MFCSRGGLKNGGHLFRAVYVLVSLSFVQDNVTYEAMELDMALTESKYLHFHCMNQSMHFCLSCLVISQ